MMRMTMKERNKRTRMKGSRGVKRETGVKWALTKSERGGGRGGSRRRRSGWSCSGGGGILRRGFERC